MTNAASRFSDQYQWITIVTLSEAKSLVLTRENEILRRFAPQNDVTLPVVGCQTAQLSENRDLLRLGKPRSGRKTEPVYKIGEKGIASWVVQNKRSYLCPDVENDPLFTKSFSGKNLFGFICSHLVRR